MKKRLLLGLIAVALLSPVSAGEILRLDYEGFTVWIDCEKRGAVAFRYNAQHDTGNRPRHKNFYLDPHVPSRCQQTSTSSYKHPGTRYDRGHLVPANHLDWGPVEEPPKMTSLRQCVTNIL